MKYYYEKADAFTGGESKGNPAAFVVLGEDHLTDAQFLEIAKEHAGFVSEMVFCEKSANAAYKLTYYSSECEVEFCGHGTIATMYELIKNDPMLLSRPEIKIETNRKGTLTVRNRIQEDDAIYITAPDAEYLPLTVEKAPVAKALGISDNAFDSTYPMELIDAGLRTLLVPIADFTTEVSMFPEEAGLKQFCEENGIDIILVFCLQTKEEENFAHTRVFAPRFGYLEDPATGSGSSAFGYYLKKHELWDGSPIGLEQGGEDRIFNKVRLLFDDEKVLFGGGATLRIRGEYYL